MLLRYKFHKTFADYAVLWGAGGPRRPRIRKLFNQDGCQNHKKHSQVECKSALRATQKTFSKINNMQVSGLKRPFPY